MLAYDVEQKDFQDSKNLKNLKQGPSDCNIE